jgi:hypothetical protein
MCENNEKAWRPHKTRHTWPERSGRFVANIAKCFGDDAPLRAIASLIWDRGTHLEPYNYTISGLHLRVKSAIQQSIEKNACLCVYDEWAGELAKDSL